MLIGAFRYTASDDGKVFLLIAARGVGVDEGCFAGAQIAIANDAGFHVLGCHCCVLLMIGVWGGSEGRPPRRMRVQALCPQRRALRVIPPSRLTAVKTICAAVHHSEIACLQQDLLPDGCFIEQRPFAAQSPRAKLCVTCAKDVDICPCRRAETAPTVVFAV